MNHINPTHVYVARRKCGCVTGLVSDLGDKATGKSVCEMIGGGLTIDRVSFDDYKAKIIAEPTFMKCPHGQQSFVMEA